MTREDIEAQAPPEHRLMLQTAHPKKVFRYACDRGWISEAEYKAAREQYGPDWEGGS